MCVHACVDMHAWLCISGSPETYYIDQAGLELKGIHLHLSPKCWMYSGTQGSQKIVSDTLPRVKLQAVVSWLTQVLYLIELRTSWNIASAFIYWSISLALRKLFVLFWFLFVETGIRKYFYWETWVGTTGLKCGKRIGCLFKYLWKLKPTINKCY